jgi:hypothetical protein
LIGSVSSAATAVLVGADGWRVVVAPGEVPVEDWVAVAVAVVVDAVVVGVVVVGVDEVVVVAAAPVVVVLVELLDPPAPHPPIIESTIRATMPHVII